jgi:hypothetical protein
MRVCYLIQSHRDPRQIARLVAALGGMSPGAFVLVVHDTAGCALDPRALESAAETRCIPARGPVRRGYLSMLEPWFQGVEWLRGAGIDYDWLVYLSGQDYPTQPLARSEAALAEADCDGFIRWWPALGTTGPWRRRRQGHRRYYYRYRDAPRWAAPALRLARALNGVQSLVHVHLAYGPRIGLRARRTPFDAGRVCYAGWQWTTLRRACAEFVLAAVERERELVEYYRRTICPDESLVQTLLLNDGRFRLVDDNLRYADTGGPEGRARVLGVADLDEITRDRYHFARKFDLDHDARVLDLLDERLGRAWAAGAPRR